MAETGAVAPGDAGDTPRFALGIGLTNECNLSCAFCYRDPSRVDRLDLEQVRAVLDRLPVHSVNLGMGENGMHPQFRDMLALLHSRNLKLAMTSNGLSVAVLRDDELRAFHDLEFSLDYPTREEQDAQRGAGNWDLVHAQAERCRRLGVPVTIVAVMMRTNFRRLAEIAGIAVRRSTPLPLVTRTGVGNTGGRSLTAMSRAAESRVNCIAGVTTPTDRSNGAATKSSGTPPVAVSNTM